jgi:hypothetical protein
MVVGLADSGAKSAMRIILFVKPALRSLSHATSTRTTNRSGWMAA